MSILLENLKLIKSHKNWKNVDFGHVLDLTPGAVSNVFSGKNKVSIMRLEKLVKKLNLSNVSELTKKKLTINDLVSAQLRDISNELNEPTVIYQTSKRKNEIPIIKSEDFENIGSNYPNAIGYISFTKIHEGVAIISPYELEEFKKDDLLIISRSPHMLEQEEIYIIKFTNRVALVKVLDISNYPQVELLEDGIKLFVDMNREQIFVIDTKINITHYE